MIDSINALEADLDYAERMVRNGYGTPQQAAQVCGVKLSDLEARLACERTPENAPPAWRRYLS